MKTAGNVAQFVERVAGAVHFPVAGNEWADSWRHSALPSKSMFARATSLPKTSHKAIDTGGEGRYCASFMQAHATMRVYGICYMLESMRSAAGTWVAKLLLLLLVVSFAIWGISGQMMSQFGGRPGGHGRRHACYRCRIPPRL
jgi:hypothetical protein